MNQNHILAGVDEVGRGPAAGPVTVAAVILPPKFELPGLTDSKLLSVTRRERMAIEIKRQALAIGIGWSSHTYIDDQGLTAALRKAGDRALAGLSLTPQKVVLDGNHNYLTFDCYTQTMVKAEQKVPAVAAASIIAKVARDRYMELLGARYPKYGFADHKGYLTARHKAALQQHGPSVVHRRSWAPVAGLL